MLFRDFFLAGRLSSHALSRLFLAGRLSIPHPLLLSLLYAPSALPAPRRRLARASLSPEDASDDFRHVPWLNRLPARRVNNLELEIAA
jgi:hypothetical protein